VASAFLLEQVFTRTGFKWCSYQRQASLNPLGESAKKKGRGDSPQGTNSRITVLQIHAPPALSQTVKTLTLSKLITARRGSSCLSIPSNLLFILRGKVLVYFSWKLNLHSNFSAFQHCISASSTAPLSLNERHTEYFRHRQSWLKIPCNKICGSFLRTATIQRLLPH
jgi:hypothetical protein